MPNEIVDGPVLRKLTRLIGENADTCSSCSPDLRICPAHAAQAVLDACRQQKLTILDEPAAAQLVATSVAETNRQVVELLPQPCPLPDVAAGEDGCPCDAGVCWPCQLTQAIWLARGIDPDAEQKRLIAAARQAMAIDNMPGGGQR